MKKSTGTFYRIIINCSSLNPAKNRKAIFASGESQGKSGSFFFFSHDRKFLIKTMNIDELKVMTKLLKDYHKHCIDNKNSLIARIYGIFSVKMPGVEAMHVLLMENSLQVDTSEDIINIFDLKGSMINREVKQVNGQQFKNTQTLKDRNFLQLRKEKNVICSP